MRKKIAMRKGGKVAKYAEGGRVGGPRPQEDRARMAAEAAPGFDAEEERMLARRRAANPWARGESIITNRPVGAAPRPAPAAEAPITARAGSEMLGPNPEPIEARTGRSAFGPAAPRARQASTVTRTRSREMSADELNDREMTRILNERSLEAARAGRNMYRKGGAVKAKKGSR